jgi:ABC-type glycerol-3-phosphate transport system permease component
MVPFQVLVVPLFIEVKAFGWENSYPGLLIPGMMNAFGVLMMRQYASDLPDELPEAARVDGASEFRIFLQIALPLLLPALASLAIIVFIWSWGAFLWPLVIVQGKALNVLSWASPRTPKLITDSPCGAQRWRHRRWRPFPSPRRSFSSSVIS